MDATIKSTLLDAVKRICDVDIQSRVGGPGNSDISPRLAGDLRRRAIAAGVFKRIGRFTYGKWSAFDAWLAAGGEVETRRGRKAKPVEVPADPATSKTNRTFAEKQPGRMRRVGLLKDVP